MPPAIPDRWIPYSACGSVIEGTRIVSFKVPLRPSVQKGNSEIKEIWDIVALVKRIPGLKAVVDLTNTTRYYDVKDFEKFGVRHKKIFIPGRIIPPESKVQEFMDFVDKVLQDDAAVIGVHCTHGLNRTGYMVCRYMRDRLKVPARLAIDRFQKARGYKIERENYIADLLGSKPPPPDIGKDTTIKPIKPANSVRKRSKHTFVLDEEDDIEGITRGNRKKSNSHTSSSSKESSANRSSHGRSKAKATKPSKSRKYFEYDYRFDY